MEKPKEHPRVAIVGGGRAQMTLALMLALAHRPVLGGREALFAKSPPQPEPAKDPHVMLRLGREVRRRVRSFYPDFPVAQNRGQILAKLNAFYSQRPRPWRPKANAHRIRRGEYTAPKVRVTLHDIVNKNDRDIESAFGVPGHLLKANPCT